jgi:DNA polymerase
MTTLWIDIETRSRCDLKTRGVYNYSRDKTTKILCLAYAFGDEDVKVWTPGYTLPKAVLEHKGQIRAHNAAFERLVLGHQGFPYALEQFYCTASQARANCYPGSLEDVGRFAGTDMRKDHRGALLVRKLCIPDAAGAFNDDPLLMAELYDYCAQDVRTMREASQAMRELSALELAEYRTNERINDRGILLDVELAYAAMKYAAAELEEVQALAADITRGQVLTLRSSKLRDWVWANTGDTAHDLMRVTKDGVEKISLDKTVRRNLLVLAEESNNEVPPEVADVIQCADDIWASSTAKFKRLTGLADVGDNRVRGAFVFAGGAATGRASSYGAQLHNFTRKCVKEADACRRAMVAGEPITPAFGSRVTDALKGMLRPSLIAAPGNSLVVADWSSIEARVSPWASNSVAGERKLELFRTGADVYKVNASATFGVELGDVTDAQRQVGKVQELSCGFGGGVEAFAAMGRAYNVTMSEAEADRMVKAWRRANPWASVYWSDLEDAYTRAMRNPNHVFAAGRVKYLFDGVHLWYALPSERVLRYPFARLDGDGVSYAKCSWKPAATAKEWPRARLWRGLACENITQAIAADILREALAKLERDGVTAHVHDEIILEVKTEDAARAEAAMRLVMTTPPAWCEGLPLAVEIRRMQRYGK